MTKYRVLSLLQEHADGFVSGEALSDALGVSRTAVWKAVKALRADGYDIQAVTNKGYRLGVQAQDVISEYEIRSHLHTRLIGRTVEVLDRVSSTNTYARALADNPSYNGHVVLANAQTNGKSKLHHDFVSPQGAGVYLSTVLRPANGKLEDLPALRKATLNAVIQAVQEVTGVTVHLRALSELEADGRKVGGILTDVSVESESGRVDYAVIGIGLYVSQTAFSEEMQKEMVSLEQLSGQTVSRLKLICALLQALDEALAPFAEETDCSSQ